MPVSSVVPLSKDRLFAAHQVQHANCYSLLAILFFGHPNSVVSPFFLQLFAIDGRVADGVLFTLAQLTRREILSALEPKADHPSKWKPTVFNPLFPNRLWFLRFVPTAVGLSRTIASKLW